MDVSVTGYPADGDYGFKGHTQWKTSGKIASVDRLTFTYDALTFGGYSGGPVWKNDDNTIIGIHAWGDNSGDARAFRTNSRIVTLIVNLREQWNNENS